jgi:hypothetical protein
MTYSAVPCACGHTSCKDWHVSNVADIQGVRFTKEQAEAVANLLNHKPARRRKPEPATITPTRVLGSKLKVGDTIEVWWAPKRDTITALSPYTGTLKRLFPKGAQLASFAICKTGMTIENDNYFTVIARSGR